MSQNIKDSVVKVHAVYDEPDFYRPWQMKGQRQSSGSGCIIDGRRILTNAHVVANQTFMQVERGGQARKCVARPIIVGHECDLAILEVDDRSFFNGSRPLPLGELPHIGDKVSAYGFPKGGKRLAITEGIVSRVENLTYSQSWAELLCCQIDAPINPGSSGGPVVSNGHIVGVAFQAGEGQNIGYMVPPPVIRHFLEDCADGDYKGTPQLIVNCQNMENPSIRAKYGMRKDQTGVLVTKVPYNSPSRGKIRPGDVVMRVGGFPVANDGTVEFRDGERTALSYASQQLHIGETIEVELLRQGRVRKTRVTLTKSLSDCYMTPRPQYETPPTYYVIGGLVFAPVTTNLLMEWDSIEEAPRELAAYYFRDQEKARQEAIALIQILPDELNYGYDGLIYTVIESVNGKKIANMRELVEAFENPPDGYYTVVNENSDRILLPVDRVRRRSKAILQRYHVPADRSVDLKPAKPAARKRRKG